MAFLHRHAELKPTKLELLSGWLPARPWYPGAAEADLRRVTSYRFDDPDGEVGVETLIVQAGDGPLLQTPLTYRGAPLDGADAWLVGTMHHTALGPRWVYDASGDPVYATVLAHAIVTGGANAEEYVEIDGQLVRREPTIWVRGSGTQAAPGVATLTDVDGGDPIVIRTQSLELTVPRVLDSGPGRADLTLTGTWTGQDTPVLLATARPR